MPAGGASPKYVIANRALMAVAEQIQAFATNKGAAPRKIHAGLFVFQGDSARRQSSSGRSMRGAGKLGPDFSNPSGNTPLGNTLTVAAGVLGSPLPRKHVLVITDGMNTAGPTPGRHAQAQAAGGTKGPACRCISLRSMSMPRCLTL